MVLVPDVELGDHCVLVDEYPVDGRQVLDGDLVRLGEEAFLDQVRCHPCDVEPVGGEHCPERFVVGLFRFGRRIGFSGSDRPNAFRLSPMLDGLFGDPEPGGDRGRSVGLVER